MPPKTQGRPPARPPATAYDYRKHITLVQVLASENVETNIRALADAWGVAIVEDRSDPPFRPMSLKLTVAALAQYAIEQSKNNEV